ncbi:uncharacterized protein AMSG_06196 [Thecamonas trahens ATCC 50062]|uniref:Helicase ATP-binding domain-containing protein n=1 Tax=Thecamonas trahens ATCC 50062 TaxID=461836 RepID=A0A0L0DCP6_THETB|nr:hypothetical protein AMSG_06196 [Thecamonas trahens ATCC 50062]KNC49896.1 hypothetical protein AMSG_06196 [Thecamonas trahens ATCC 50062]|eukprot:XP_013757377.1 hypothetical protein AMSG_06196 [Thecamonas trahens ATCC 50062]
MSSSVDDLVVPISAMAIFSDHGCAAKLKESAHGGRAGDEVSEPDPLVAAVRQHGLAAAGTDVFDGVDVEMEVDNECMDDGALTILAAGVIHVSIYTDTDKEKSHSFPGGGDLYLANLKFEHMPEHAIKAGRYFASKWEPDFVVLCKRGSKVEITVCDAKASSVSKASHIVQVSVYAKLLEAMVKLIKVESNGCMVSLSELVSFSDTGLVWRPNGVDTFSLKAMWPMVEDEIAAGAMPLAALTCRELAIANDSIIKVPYISGHDADKIRRVHGGDEGSFTFALEKKLVPDAFSDAYEHKKAVVLGQHVRSTLLPAGSESCFTVAVTILREPQKDGAYGWCVFDGHGIPFATVPYSGDFVPLDSRATASLSEAHKELVVALAGVLRDKVHAQVVVPTQHERDLLFHVVKTTLAKAKPGSELAVAAKFLVTNLVRNIDAAEFTTDFNPLVGLEGKQIEAASEAMEASMAPVVVVLEAAVRELVALPVPGIYLLSDMVTYLVAAGNLALDPDFASECALYQMCSSGQFGGAKKVLLARTRALLLVLAGLRELSEGSPFVHSPPRLVPWSSITPGAPGVLDQAAFHVRMELATGLWSARTKRLQTLGGKLSGVPSPEPPTALGESTYPETLSQGAAPAQHQSGNTLPNSTVPQAELPAPTLPRVIMGNVVGIRPVCNATSTLEIEVTHGHEHVRKDKLRSRLVYPRMLAGENSLFKDALHVNKAKMTSLVDLSLASAGIGSTNPEEGNILMKFPRHPHLENLKCGVPVVIEPRVIDFASAKILAQTAKGVEENHVFVELVQDPKEWMAGEALPVLGLDTEISELVDSSGLDESQKNVIKRVLSTESGKLTVCHGPPGTGKTQVIVQLMMMAADLACKSGKKLRILYMAATNNPLDDGLKKVQQALKRKGGLATKVKAAKLRSQLPIGNHKVVIMFATPYKAATLFERSMHKVDLLIVEEASQLPVTMGILGLAQLKPEGRLLVVGDHKQLPPVLSCKPIEPAAVPLATSLLECVVRNDNNEPFLVSEPKVGDSKCDYLLSLKTNYRTNKVLGHFHAEHYTNYQNANGLSDNDGQLWDDNLLASGLDSSVVGVKLSQEIAATPEAAAAAEAKAVVQVVSSIAAAATASLKGEIMIVTPFRAQRAKVLAELKAAVSTDDFKWLGEVVDTAEVTQGREAALVIVCCAFTAEYMARRAEFVYSVRRLNVATSRAKRKVVVIFTDALLKPPLQSLVKKDTQDGHAYISRLLRSGSVVDAENLESLPAGRKITLDRSRKRSREDGEWDDADADADDSWVAGPSLKRSKP